MTTVPATGRQRTLRVLALAALILGLVAMHHLAGVGGHQQAGSVAHTVEAHHDTGVPAVDAGSGGAHDTPASGSGTHLLHLCLAVLSAAVLLLLTRAWRRVPPGQSPRGIAAVRRQPARMPAVYGGTLLTRLCVMRT